MDRNLDILFGFVFRNIDFFLALVALIIAIKARRRVKDLGEEVGSLREKLSVVTTRFAELRARLSAPEILNQPPPIETNAPSQASIAYEPPYVDEEEAESESINASIEAELLQFAQDDPVALEANEPISIQSPALSSPHPQVHNLSMMEEPAKPEQESLSRPINLEQFMGAKLFAWVGGLALFLGIIFFVKLSIERGWISPELRTAIGFVIGAGLVGGGVMINRREQYATLAQTLCATGIVILYGVSYAAHAMYHIPPFNQPWVTFGFMTLVTATAFLLAVRLDAKVVAILGMLGGFLTPFLCSTGQDNPFGLFSYIALLDIGVLAVANHKRWLHFPVLATVGTILTQCGWMIKFFIPREYAMGSATWVPVSVFLGFAVLFMLGTWWSRRRDEEEVLPASCALALCGSALFTAYWFLGFGAITERPLLLYGFLLGINAVVMLTVWWQPRMAAAQGIVAALTFLHLTIWTTLRLTPEMLPYALGIYLAFGLMHTAFAVLWQRLKQGGSELISWTPVTTLLLLLLPLLCLPSISLMIWPAILLMDLLIIGLAILTGAVLRVLAALVLTLCAAGMWLFGHPANAAAGMGLFLLLVGGFAVLFAAAGIFISRRLPGHSYASMLPVSSALLPFALLILATLELRPADPSPVFGLALLLALFLLGLARISSITTLIPTALGCVLALQYAWHYKNWHENSSITTLLWHTGFYALFVACPLVFQKAFAARKLPWITSAAAGLGTFGLVYRFTMVAWPETPMGMIPALFTIAPLCCLVFVLKNHSLDNPARMTQLAWLGGVALFFITLIFPFQFEKQWITIGWALEGAALCWIFLRVPHPGLRGTGAVLLGVAFVRLALNPAVFAYQTRGDTAFLNWQLYAYSISALSMFCAAYWLNPPNHYWNKVNLRGLFTSFGGILIFLLLNIEIADAFTPVGSRSIAFNFGENFARDMTYTISWALFALGLLVIGIWKRNAHTRYAGIGLLVAALFKLFFHDLANIENIFRIGALIVVALVALAASFLYQRFLTADKP